ncbi:hypothetical protein [uncultured Secundilactobacillus sp.]|uniref:hypothetical protein n=1 Tax=uncultured Secundilactobacillus sp. TaxID=2813935 RepID=UPI0025836AE3|nr:hypothetical protein [uncultured Secundilactobacillus sp.]
MEKDYSELMTQLKSGELDALEVHPDEFMAFYEAYMAFESRKRIVGAAEKNGIITYHYDHEQG